VFIDDGKGTGEL